MSAFESLVSRHEARLYSFLRQITGRGTDPDNDTLRYAWRASAGFLVTKDKALLRLAQEDVDGWRRFVREGDLLEVLPYHKHRVRVFSSLV